MILGFGFLIYKEPKELFLYYFLPILTVFPVYYQTEVVPGTPELSFWSAALVPILLFWVVNKKVEGYFFSWLDLIILIHLLLVFYGQYINSSYKPAQKVFFNDLMARFFPYVLAKAYCSDRETRIEMIKVIVVVGAIVGFFMMYEFKQWYNVFDKPIREIWPHWVAWDLPMKRWGLKRAFGPFAHPICGGYFFAMVAPLAIWLWRGKYFSKGLWKFSSPKDLWGPKVALAIVLIPFALVPLAGLKKMTVLAMILGFVLIFVIRYGMIHRITKIPWGPAFVLLCVGGGIASISRAPMAGIFLGFAIIWFGWARRKGLVFGILFGLVCVSLPVVLPRVISYVNVDRATAETADQRNAAYRKELMENYMEVSAEKPWFGWGRFSVPVVKGQESIDNEYLFMLLTSGRMALYPYILMMAYVSIRLLLFVRRQPYDSQEGRLAWCLIAGWAAAIFTQSTVYAGTQTVQYFYLMAGMIEALVSAPVSVPAVVREKIEAVPASVLAYGFVRTVPASIPAVPSGMKEETMGVGHEYHFSRTL